MTVTADAATADIIITKSEFARRRNVTPGRVSQWIAEGKIDGDALVGEGREQRINETAAVAQLLARLDTSQRLGNGFGTRLGAPAPVPPSPAAALPPQQVGVPAANEEDCRKGNVAAGAPSSQAAAPSDRIDEQLKQAKLEQVQRANRVAAEAELARAGRYVLADQARAERVKFARDVLVTVEGGMQDIADRIAAAFGLPARDVLHLVRKEFRAVRERIAASARARAEVLPEFVDHDPTSVEADAALAPELVG